MLRTLAVIAIACINLIPLYVYGYATNIAFLDCACKWRKEQIVVWIDNSQEEIYTDYTIEALDAWHEGFPKLRYIVYTNFTQKWDIHIRIIDRYLDEENAGVLAKSDILADWSGSSINKVSITIPVHIAERNSEEIEFNKMSDTMFYNIILHEIGHAIGLGHANENEEGTIDPMFKYIGKNEEQRSISKLDVMTLQRLYR
ncbi:MAG: matrixin family metalloprotease [Nitrososphaerales archaeon]